LGGEDLVTLDREIARNALDDAKIERPLTIAGVTVTAAMGLMAAIGNFERFGAARNWSATSG
jgi:hypothetical protein